MNISRGCALLVDITCLPCDPIVGTGEHFQNRQAPRNPPAGNTDLLWITRTALQVPYAAAKRVCPQSTTPTTTTDNSFFLEIERLP